jgi:hypothetical protein
MIFKARLHDLGSCAPMITFQTFLDYLAPPQPDFDLNATMQSLKLGSEPALTSSNQWSMFSEAPKDLKVQRIEYLVRCQRSSRKSWLPSLQIRAEN